MKWAMFGLGVLLVGVETWVDTSTGGAAASALMCVAVAVCFHIYEVNTRGKA